MAITLTTDMILGIGALIVAAVAIMIFLRATEGTKKPTEKEDENERPGLDFNPGADGQDSEHPHRHGWTRGGQEEQSHTAPFQVGLEDQAGTEAADEEGESHRIRQEVGNPVESKWHDGHEKTADTGEERDGEQTVAAILLRPVHSQI